MGLSRAIAYEQGDKLYVVTPVRPIRPSKEEIAGFEFGRSIVDDLRDKAPNPNIAWYAGQYVEAERPNKNGAMWLSDEIAVKSLTPMLMPVTVMHDPRTAVGLIADTKLLSPPQVPRNKIETALALWKHRFPEIVEEAEHNYSAGTLMQSMECLSPDYACSECGTNFTRLPDGVEREQWCDCLKTSNPPHPADYADHDPGREVPTAVRILRNVVFTGTGLIFGSQGGTGADPEAHLESFIGEVAEHHDRAHRATGNQRSTPRMDTVTKAEFDRVVAERDAAIAERDTAKGEATQAKTDLETVEAAKVAAETAKDAAEKKVTDFEEAKRKDELATERLNALGDGFTEKLGDKTKSHLREDAKTLGDDEWNRRLESLEETADVKRDAKKDGSEGDAAGSEEFSAEEVARTGAGASAGAPTQTKGQTPGVRKSVMAGLVSGPKKD